MHTSPNTDDPVPFATTLADDSPFFARRHGVFYPKGHTVLAFESVRALARPGRNRSGPRYPAGRPWP